ncbi:unnamed protein product [Echinostoma caproni]|uniref:Actin-related protein 10 n=1 Tax=Echinostoma caproni TaxID=27848 RepID=A0A183BD25_9TREM|nr:unnamed protein product [Echinostoma caproni]
MPGFESLILGEKTAVIFDIGSAYTKHLLVNPKDRRVVVIESVLSTSEFRDLVADVLYNHFEVYEGYTLLNSWQASQLGSRAVFKFVLFLRIIVSIRNLEELLQKDASIVNETGDVVPLASCPPRTAFVSPASRAEEWQKWLDAQVDEETANKVNPPKVAEDAFYYPLNSLSGSKRLLIPSRIRELSVECLFTCDNDRITLATLLLKSIQSSPIDIRR